MAIAGLRGTGNWGTDERPKNFREMILWLNPNGSAPLLALTSKMPKSTTNDPEFAWWEETMSIIRLQLNDGTNMNSSDTVFVVNNGLNGCTAQDLKVGDLLLVEEGAETNSYAYEIVQVTAITSATQFSASRGAANSTAASITDDSWFTKIGSAYEEGSAQAAATSRNPTKFYNYTQIFKDTYSITKTALATNARTGDVEKNDKKRKVFDHSTAIEMAALFGKRYETTGSNSLPLRYTGGLMHFLGSVSATTRIDVATAMSGATGINTLIDTIVDVFDYSGGGNTGGDERIAFVGNTAMTAISKAAVAAGTVMFGEVVKVYGMNVTKLVIPQGTFYIKTHPLMNQHPRYTSAMFIIDPPGVKYRPLQGRDTKSEDNTQTPGDDAKKGQWITEAGFEFNHLQTMKYLAAISFS